MSLRVFTNTISLNAQRAMSVSSAKMESTLERVASGIRLQRSSDNNGAFHQTETLRGDVSTLRQGAKNLNDGISMIRTAEGALNEQISILMRLREITSQSMSGTLGDTERATQNLEFSALRAEFDRIAEMVWRQKVLSDNRNEGCRGFALFLSGTPFSWQHCACCIG